MLNKLAIALLELIDASQESDTTYRGFNGSVCIRSTSRSLEIDGYVLGS
jgi:hypothetical protein